MVEIVDDEKTPVQQVIAGVETALGWCLDCVGKSPTVVIRTLIQLGHEPIAAKPYTNFLGQQGYIRPGIISYSQEICQGDYTILLTGLKARLCHKVVYTYVMKTSREFLQKTLKSKGENKGELGEQEEKPVVQQVVQDIVIDSLAACTACTISYPLQAVSVNTIAQLVGKETTFDGVIPGLTHLYTSGGFLSMYRGLVPALSAEVTMVVTCGLLKVAFDEYMTPKLTGSRDHHTPEQKHLSESISMALATLLANPLYYPFQVVHTIMVVNNSGLKAGMPPITPLFNTWTDCLSYLWQQPAHRGLQRGASNLRRFTYIE